MPRNKVPPSSRNVETAPVSTLVSIVEARDPAFSTLAPLTSELLPAGTSAVLVRSFRIAAGTTFRIALGARMRIL